jgi:parvulin-like peptidyl-prolyl isomerase
VRLEKKRVNNTNRRRQLLVTLVVSTLIALVVSCGTPAAPTPTAVPANTPVGAPTAAASRTPLPQQTIAPEMLTPTVELATPTLAPSTLTPVVAAAALVNGQAIPAQEHEDQVSQALAVLSETQNLDPDTEEGKAALLQLRRQILDSLIEQALIEQAATREGISISEQQVEEEMARLVGENVTEFEEWLGANGLTREAFKVQLQRQLLSAAFQEHLVGSLPLAVEQVHARHILLMSEAEAMDILLRLRSGEDFGTLAKQYSQDKASSELGGDLGFFPRNVMPAELEAVAFALAPGQISGIVQTDFGYHIVEVVEKDPAREVPEEMLATWRQNHFLQWLEAQRSVAKIEYLIPME